MTIVQDDSTLFDKGELYPFLQSRMNQAEHEADNFNSQAVLSATFGDVLASLIDKYQVNAIELRESEIEMTSGEGQLNTSRIPDGRLIYPNKQNVPATIVRLHVPFDGDRTLFTLQSNVYGMVSPRGTVQGNELVITLTSVDPDDEALKNRFDSILGSIRTSIRNQRHLVDDFSRRLPDVLEAHLQSRKSKLLKAANSVAAIGFPLRRREDAAQTFVVPTVRRKVRIPPKPSSSSMPSAPEPVISDEDYEHILTVMQNMALVLERSPSAFRTMDEEAIRTHFLVQLNGHYEGSATAETFNSEGKTDILIRHEGKNLFIAECKFWSGPDGFALAIDQLLGYLSWRDCKTALVVLARKVKISTVLEKVPQEIKKHPRYRREIPAGAPGRFNAVFAHKNDDSRELLLTVLVFDVPGTTV